EAMLNEGADIIDVGGESTRPGATEVSVADELARVLPVIERLAATHPDATLSIDTVKSEVARAALEAGAHIVNDVSALRLDPAVSDVCAAFGAGLVLMHSRGDVSDMASHVHATYGHVVDEVLSELGERLDAATKAGVARESIALDPGVGFSKRTMHSLAVLGGLPRLAALDGGHPVLVGVSRKRFIGEITGVRDAAERLSGTLGANVAALALGARIFRVHDVRPAREALDVAWQILR
ncbi:MAG TPA: dihydropteroate synthase, partial [Gemmatimonadaceae bacterium]|nr:dihydropteroate synthase [Gemmatimonadaceae bacterium]